MAKWWTWYIGYDASRIDEVPTLWRAQVKKLIEPQTSESE